MEAISLKMEKKLLQDIDATIKKHRYSTRTEFIRDAIRKLLGDLEREYAIYRLGKLKGSLKGRVMMSDKQAGELAMKEHLKKFNLSLD